MFNLQRITTIARVSLIVALMTGLMRVNPAQAANHGNFHVDESNTFSKVSVQTPHYPVGMGGGESKLVPYSISELPNISGRITSRTYQFFTQYDVPITIPSPKLLASERRTSTFVANFQGLQAY